MNQRKIWQHDSGGQHRKERVLKSSKGRKSQSSRCSCVQWSQCSQCRSVLEFRADFPSQERPVSISQFGDGFEPEELSWTSQPEFSKNYTGWACSAMSLRDNNYIWCIKLLSHLVGREDKEREGQRRDYWRSAREKGGCGMRACVPACMRVTISLAQFYRNSKLDPGEDRTSQKILSKVVWDETEQFTEKPRDARLKSAWKIVQRLQASRPRPRDTTAKEPLWSQPKQHSWSTALFSFFHL